MKKLLLMLCMVMTMTVVFTGCGETGGSEKRTGKEKVAKLPDVFQGEVQENANITVENGKDGEFSFSVPEAKSTYDNNYSEGDRTHTALDLTGKMIIKEGKLSGTVKTSATKITKIVNNSNKLSEAEKSNGAKPTTSVETYTLIPTGAEGKVEIKSDGKYVFSIPCKMKCVTKSSSGYENESKETDEDFRIELVEVK